MYTISDQAGQPFVITGAIDIAQGVERQILAVTDLGAYCGPEGCAARAGL